MEWKRLAVRTFSFGLGFGLVIAVLIVANLIYKHYEETRPWTSPMRATFTGLQIRQPAGMINIEFDYAIENPSNKDYRIPAGSAILMRLPNGNGYAGNEQAHVSLKNDTFVPSKQKVNIRVLWSLRSEDYTLPSEDSKVTLFADRMLTGNDGFAIFDHDNRFRTELPNVWKDWDGVKKILEEQKLKQ